MIAGKCQNFSLTPYTIVYALSGVEISMERIVSGESGFFLSETAVKASYEAYFGVSDQLHEGRWDIFVLINRKGYWY